MSDINWFNVIDKVWELIYDIGTWLIAGVIAFTLLFIAVFTVTAAVILALRVL